MKSIVTTLTTEAVFTDDGVKRYLIRKTWDESRPKLAVIMLAPSEASGIELDTTTQLVLNNAARLGYGRVDVLNLFATLNDFSLKQAEDKDTYNMDAIFESVRDADDVVYAPGVGKAKNKSFQQRQEQVLSALRPYEGKLRCLTDANGKARFQHPLSPAVRAWHLSPMQISELLPEHEPQDRGKPDTAKQRKNHKSAEKNTASLP